MDAGVNYYTNLSDFGKIVQTEWMKSFEIRTELMLDCFVIMPNHLHAIVEIRHSNDLDFTVRDAQPCNYTDARPCISTNKMLENNVTNIINYSDKSSNHPIDDLILMDQTLPYGSLHRLPQSLSSFIAGFKSAVNTQIDDYIDEHQLKIPKYNKNNHFFQSNYHDHIVRNEGEYFRIRDYINENPDKWAADCFNDARITD